MKGLNQIIVGCLVVLLITAGCADSKEFESLKIYPEYNPAESEPICCPDSINVSCDNSSDFKSHGTRQFLVKGIFSDDSEKDLTNEVTWATDSSGDNVISSEKGGYVYCDRASGSFILSATYKLNTSDSGSSGGDASTYKDSIEILVNQ